MATFYMSLYLSDEEAKKYMKNKAKYHAIGRQAIKGALTNDDKA